MKKGPFESVRFPPLSHILISFRIQWRQRRRRGCCNFWDFLQASTLTHILCCSSTPYDTKLNYPDQIIGVLLLPPSSERWGVGRRRRPTRCHQAHTVGMHTLGFQFALRTMCSNLSELCNLPLILLKEDNSVRSVIVMEETNTKQNYASWYF